MSNIVGMAIKITEENRQQIAVVNAGVVPMTEYTTLYGGAYFIFPYDADAHCNILPGYAFFQNFDFVSPENPDHFVQIEEI